MGIRISEAFGKLCSLAGRSLFRDMVVFGQKEASKVCFFFVFLNGGHSLGLA